MFQTMVLTNRKYIEPSQVLKALVDDFGNVIEFGEQKDIGEFNLNLLQRVEEGLGERQAKPKEGEEEKKEDKKHQKLDRRNSSMIFDDDVEGKSLEEVMDSMTVS
jgi:ubiquitin carboxyl-terminal hydrolase 25/28